MSRSSKGDHDLVKVFFELRLYFDLLVIRKEVLSESSHRIERHLDMVKEVLEI